MQLFVFISVIFGNVVYNEGNNIEIKICINWLKINESQYKQSSIYYVRKIFRKTNISYLLIRTWMQVCVSEGNEC